MHPYRRADLRVVLLLRRLVQKNALEGAVGDVPAVEHAVNEIPPMRAYARSTASRRFAPSPVTERTRPPEVTTLLPSSLGTRFVPQWNTIVSGFASASPEIS